MKVNGPICGTHGGFVAKETYIVAKSWESLAGTKRRRAKENSTYQMTVSGLEGLIDGFTDLTGLRLPGTKPKLTRERSVELEQTDPGSEVPWKRRAGRRPTGW